MSRRRDRPTALTMRDVLMRWFSLLMDTQSWIDATDRVGTRRGLYDALQHGIGLFAEARRAGRKALFVGNGASAAIASHQALDWWKTAGLRALAFNDLASLTACANDLGYAEVFAAPIRAFADPGDLLVAISSSGQSENILRAAAAAHEHGCQVITLSGFDESNALRRLGDLNFHVASHCYGHVEVCHLALCHALLDTCVEVHGGAGARALLGGAALLPEAAQETPHPWTDFLAARCRVIGWMHDEGKADADIAAALSMYDVTQVTLLRMTARPVSDERPTAAATPLIAQLRVEDVE